MGSSSGSVSRARWVAVFALVLLAVSAVPVLAEAPPEDPQVTLPPNPEDFDPSKLPTGEDVAAAIDQAEAEEDQRQQWLASAGAIQEREASQSAYADISTAEAEALLGSTFAAQLSTLNSDPARFLSDAQLVAPSEEETDATVKDAGNTMVMDAAIPVRTEDEEGDLSKVDLSLEETSEGYETANALVDVSIPDSAAEPIEVGEDGVAISQQGAAPAQQARPFGDENVFYPEVLPDTDLLVSPTAGGVEIFNQLRSEESPETLRFEIDVPAGAELRPSGGRGAEVVDDGEVLAVIPEPAAVDAQGTDVPVELSLEGSSVVLHVDHRSGNYAMPILLDPILENNENWIYGQNHNALDMGVWGFGKNVAGMYGSTSCINHCFGYPSNLRGLFVAAQSGTYWPSQIAQWSYSAPNTNSFLTSATLSPYVRYDANCNAATTQYKEPHDYFGMWLGSAWNYVSVNSANQPGNSYTIPFTGQSAIFGLGSGGGPVFSIPCWRDLYAGGAHIWLDDSNNPYLDPPQVNGIPSGWVKNETTFTLTAKASDIGLGIQNVTISPEGTAIIYDIPKQEQCAGTRRSPCLTTHTASFDLTGASFDEGRKKAKLSAYDPVGRFTNTVEWTMQVDRTPPAVTLSGQLAEETNEVGSDEKEAGTGDVLRLPVYNLKIEAKDGSTSPDAAKRSGVKSIEVFLDAKGTPEKVWTQSYKSDSEGMTQTYPLKLIGLSSGTHTLKVLVADHAGNPPRKREIEFEYFPVTGMKDEYVMHYFPLPDGEGNEAEEEHPERPELAVNVMNGNLVYREQDIDVEGPAALDLEVERYYNSQLPASDDSEWGDGWTLAQTPKLDPIKAGGSPVPNKAEVLDSSGAFKDGVALPTAAGTSVFDADLQATIEKKEDGGYELKDQTGESGTSISFDAAGQAEALLGEGYAKVDYSYEGGHLAEAKVIDPATFSADPEELEISEPEPISKPLYASSFGTNGSADGQLKSPADVAVGAEGNLFVLDRGNNRVQKFDPSGKYLGKFGSFGSGNGQFSLPTSIAADPAGNLLVTDANEHRVQKFSPQGTFLSKFGTYGVGNGQLYSPGGVAVDSQGNVWVSDSLNGRVQKFNDKGEFLKVVGSKGTGTGQMSKPTGIDIDPSGNAWVTDWQNNRVLVFNNTGTFLSQFGSEGSGNGQFNHPQGIEVDEHGTVWVGDHGNNRVQQFDLAAQYQGQFGSTGSGAGQFSFNYPMGIVGDSKGHLWISDPNNHRIQQWLAPIERPTYDSSFGANGSADGQLKSPGDVAVGVEGNLLVLDKGNHRVEKFDPSGKFIAKFGSFGSGNGQFSLPTAIAVDRDGNVWVTDANEHRIQKFSPEGTFLAKFGAYGSGNGQFFAPEGVTTDFKGNIWVADSSNHRIQKLNEDGEFIKVVGVGKLSKPTGIDVDPIGNIWVADWANNRVVVFNNAGEFLSQFGSLGSANGQFNHPQGIEVDSRGNVWVGDLGNNRIQRFDLAAQYIGKFGIPGTGQGQFSLAAPMGIATDNRGHIWVTDVNNHRVQRWLLGNYLPITEEIEVESADPKVDVEAEGDLISSVEGAEAGEHSYAHSGDDLVSHDGPEGETKYTYDAAGRMTKVTLPNGTWASIAYHADGRVKSVTVDPAGAPAAKTTSFEYLDEPRRTTVIPPGEPVLTYDFAADGSLLKWWNAKVPPEFDYLAGSLYDNKETAQPISAGDHNFVVQAYSAEGIELIQVIADKNQLVDEETCEQDPGKTGTECVEVVNEWVTTTGNWPPGIHYIEVLATDRLSQTVSKRFWVNIPYTPPPPPGVPTPPTFHDILRFREDFGLDIDIQSEELGVNDRVFDLIGNWHNPSTPSGQVARATEANWGVPLRAVDAAEMEYRERYIDQASTAIPQWASANGAASAYAGYYVDHRQGGLIYVGFTGSQQERIAALQQNGGLIAPDRLRPFPDTPTYPLSYLESLEAAVIAGSMAGVTGIQINVEHNRVDVGAADVTQVQNALKAQFGSQAPLYVYFQSGGPGFAGGAWGRPTGPVKGAERIWGAEEGCSAGFGVWDRGGVKPDGSPLYRHFILTAGHCFLPGVRVYQWDIPGGIETHWERTLGYVRRNTMLEHPSGFGTDALVVRVEDPGIVPRLMRWSPDQDIRVEGVATPKEGMVVCIAGSSRGKSKCGDIDWPPETRRWEEVHGNGNPKLTTVEMKLNTVAGDSGGPIWERRTGYALGTTTGGEEHKAEGNFTPLKPLPGYPSAPGSLQALGIGGEALHVVQWNP